MRVAIRTADGRSRRSSSVPGEIFSPGMRLGSGFGTGAGSCFSPDLMLAEQAADIGPGKVVIHLKEDLQTTVTYERFPAFIIYDFQLRQILRNEQKLHAKT